MTEKTTNEGAAVYEYACAHGISMVEKYSEKWYHVKDCNSCSNITSAIANEPENLTTNKWSGSKLVPDWEWIHDAILPFELEKPRIYKKKVWTPDMEAVIKVKLCKRHHSALMISLFNPEQEKKTWGYIKGPQFWLQKALHCYKCEDFKFEMQKVEDGYVKQPEATEEDEDD